MRTDLVNLARLRNGVGHYDKPEVLATVAERVVEDFERPKVGGKPFRRGAFIEVRKRVANDPTFNMKLFFHECGSPACIAGHAAICAGNNNHKQPLDQWKSAAAYLGLKIALRSVNVNLFDLRCWPSRYGQLLREFGDRHAALAILDDIIAGKIDPDTLEPTNA